MRPTALSLKGFASFREPADVDFTGADLFALVGPTGSGKSTVIDAVTFALYGSVARYDHAGLVEPIINQLSNEARVRLDFELAGTAYTAVRVVRRTKSGATTREARLEQGERVLAGSAKEMDEAVPALLGLDFKRFTKTVVLPQGKFADFLHDPPKDRQELLRQLLDLGVYAGMGATARRRATRARDQAEVLTGQLDAGDVVTEADVVERERFRLAATEALENLRTHVATYTERSAELDAARADHHDYGVLVLALADVVVPETVAELGQRLDAVTEQIDQARHDRAQADEARSAARAAVAEGPDPVRCRALVEAHRDHDEAEAALAELDTELAVAQVAAHEAAAEADAVRAARVALAQTATQHRERLDAAAQAVAAQPHPSELVTVRDRRAELTGLRVELTGLAGRRDDAAAAVDAASRRRDEAAAAAATARADLDRVKNAVGAAAFAHELEVGDPCPVCRQVVTSLPDHDLDAELAAARLRAEAAARLSDERARSVADAERLATQAALRHDAAAERARALDRQLVDAPDDTAIAASLAEIARLEALLARARTEAAGATAALEAFDTDAATCAALDAERTAGDRVVSLQAHRDAKLEEVARLARRLVGAPDTITLAAELATAASLQQAATQAAASAEAAAERLAGLEADRSALAADEARERAAFGRYRDTLAGLSPPAVQGNSLVHDWHELVDWAADQAPSLASEHERAGRRADALGEEVDELRSAIEETCTPYADPVGRAPQDLLGQMIGVAAEAVAAVEHATKQLAETQRLRAEVTSLTEAADVAGELGRLLQVDGFERWLLEEIVDELVIRATDRLFELSGGQYSLLADETAFRVVDHRNADEVRDTKTLSGGETFLASLASALALGDSLAELATDDAPKLESIFLDEGFGTLDPESLDVVAAAMEELGASGRMVGIVTHIRELADRLPTRFDVSKGPGGSTVQRVEA